MGGFGRDPIPGFRKPAVPVQKVPSEPEVARLRVLNGPCAGREFTISASRVRMGRGDPPAVSVDIDLSACELGSPAMVSRLHAELIWIEGKLYVIDLGSRNGTWVNERPVEPGQGGPSDPVPVPVGGRLRIANIELQIVGPQEAAASA